MSDSSQSSDFQNFKKKLGELVSQFGKRRPHYKSQSYDEAALRNDYLNPFWRALGWDLENLEGLPQSLREVEIESRVDVAGRKKKADYLFRTDGLNRFVCEAKRPGEELSRFAFQVQRYAYNFQVYLAILTDFEELYVYVVGGTPNPKSPFDPIRKFHYSQYPLLVEELWNLLSRENVGTGSIDHFLAELPKKELKGKAHQGWLIRPERIRKVDTDFLNFIENCRKDLANDLVESNSRITWDENNLNEAVQRILDRILFIHICEDRDIDVNGTLESVLKDWQSQKFQQPLYPSLVKLFRILDKGKERSFNGGLFAPHFSENLKVSDSFLSSFLEDLAGEDSPYLFNIIPVEILGSIYERFIGKTFRISSSGKVQPFDKSGKRASGKRKAEGIYYTPQFIVKFIVENTVGKLIKNKTPDEVSKIKILDPACGSGSFLIGALNRLYEYYREWLKDNPKKQRPDLCWYDSDQNLHLTTGLKRQIVLNNLYGVDLDPQAVEVSQFSLYLKILEGETRFSLAAEHPLFKGETILPDLKNNIRLGNSLIENDYFDLFPNGDEVKRIRALDWKAAFPEVMKNGGFDAVIGNPPWGQKAVDFTPEEKEYLKLHYQSAHGILDLFKLFSERALKLTRDQGYWGMILPDIILLKDYPEIRKIILENSRIEWIAYSGLAFENVNLESVILVCSKFRSDLMTKHKINVLLSIPTLGAREIKPERKIPQSLYWKLRGFKFNIHLDQDKLALLDKLNTLPKLANFLEAHEGIHSGNIRSKLFLPKKRNRYCRKLIFGREEIRRYEMDWKGQWVNYNPEIINKRSGEYANLGHEYYFSLPKILVRRTGNYILAVPDFDGYFASNNQFVVFKKNQQVDQKKRKEEPPSLFYFTGILNSNSMTWYFRTVQPVSGNLFPELKINHIHDFPVPQMDIYNASDQDQHNQMVTLVKRDMDLLRQLRKASSDRDRRTLESGIQATGHSINQLVYKLYKLTDEEIAMVEKELPGNPLPKQAARKKADSNPQLAF